MTNTLLDVKSTSSVNSEINVSPNMRIEQNWLGNPMGKKRLTII